MADAEYGPGLAAIVKKLTARPGYTLGGEHYKRVPPGYDPAPGAEFLLRHAGLYAGLEIPIPAEIHSPDLVDFCFARFKPIEPLHRWLTAMVGGKFDL